MWNWDDWAEFAESGGGGEGDYGQNVEMHQLFGEEEGGGVWWMRSRDVMRRVRAREWNQEMSNLSGSVHHGEDDGDVLMDTLFAFHHI